VAATDPQRPKPPQSSSLSPWERAGVRAALRAFWPWAKCKASAALSALSLWERVGVRAASPTLRSTAHRLLGSALAGSALPAGAATLPEDRAELALHLYDGGGVQASGPALLLRKSLGDRVSLSAQTYVDAVSNASIDVVTTASPFREKRTAWDLGADWLVRDTLLSLAWQRSEEPDYIAQGLSLDVATEAYGGMTTVSLGFTRARDLVGRKLASGWIDRAAHWHYRAGLTQILSPRWLVSLNAEVISDEGYLGSPYRAARVFGAAVPERVPRTRTSRALKLRSTWDSSALLPRSVLRADYRHYWDTWAVRAGTWEISLSKQIKPRLVLEALVRGHAQDKALFYSDDAQAETAYATRNRQLGTLNTRAIGAKLSHSWAGLSALTELRLTASVERKQHRFADFTDLRTGQPYAYSATVVQLLASGSF